MDNLYFLTITITYSPFETLNITGFFLDINFGRNIRDGDEINRMDG